MMNHLLSKQPALLKQKENADDALVDALQRGYLSIFIGAGVSKSASQEFPKWDELVKKCCNSTSVEFDENQKESNKYLRVRMEKVHRKCTENGIGYLDNITRSLYDGIEYDIGLMKTDL